jgi:hypothetical protein
MPPREIARAYGLSVGTIRSIARGDTWHWVTEDMENSPADVDITTPPSPELDAAAAASFERFVAKSPDLAEKFADAIAKEREKLASTNRALDELKSNGG